MGICKFTAGWLAILLCQNFCYLKAASLPSGGKDDIDSARRVLNTSPEEALKLANALRERASSFGPGSARSYAVADWISAAALVHLNKPKEAWSFDQRGLQFASKHARGSVLYAELLLEKANISGLNGKVQDAVQGYQLAYNWFGQAHQPRGQALALQNIAASYLDAGDYAATLHYCRLSLEIYSEEASLRLSAYNNAGSALVQLGRFKEAEHAYEKAVRDAVQLGSPLLTTRVLANLARSQSDAGDIDAAQATLKRAFALSLNGPASSWRSALYGVSAQVALKDGNLDLAAKLINQALSGQGAAQAAVPMRDYHKTAYQIYRARGDAVEALFHLESFKKLDDEARALAASTSAALMSAKFDFANQDLKIARLRAARAEQDATLTRTRARFHTGLLTTAAIISSLLLAAYLSVRRSRNQVRAANDTLQQTNAELERALAAKGEFLATTSHEIRTPLNGILGMTQVLLHDRTVAPELRNRVELIHGAGETMRALVDDILDMAKMERGELRIHPAAMNLRRLVEDAGTIWAGQAQTKQIALELDLADCPAGIVADEVRVRQIVFNLMSNAIKFTDRGGVRLTVSAEARDEGEALLILVEDSGIGIPADRLAEIFEAFRQVDGGITRRHGGTGLGLAICRNLARAMGGDVGVVSVSGTGSRFTVELPLERADIQAARAVAAATAASLAEARLLLMEPNPLNQGILRALLTPQVRALEVAGDEAAARAILDAGGVDHLLADAAMFALDPEAARRFVGDIDVARLTLLWPSPDPATRALLCADPRVQLLVKPIAAPDLLAALRMGYHAAGASRDIAA